MNTKALATSFIQLWNSLENEDLGGVITSTISTFGVLSENEKKTNEFLAAWGPLIQVGADWVQEANRPKKSELQTRLERLNLKSLPPVPNTNIVTPGQTSAFLSWPHRTQGATNLEPQSRQPVFQPSPSPRHSNSQPYSPWLEHPSSPWYPKK